MALLANGDRVLVSFTGTLLGQRIINTFLYRLESVPAETDYDATMDLFFAELNDAAGMIPAWLDCLPENITNTQAWLQVIRPARLRRKIYTVVGGGGRSIAQTSNIQASITRQGELAGRRSIGGVRIPLNDTGLDYENGVLGLAMKNALQALADEMIETLEVGPGAIRFIPQVGTPKPPLNSFDLKDTFVQDTVRVLRRRTVGLGI